MNIGADIVHEHELYFDPAEPRNGSLYLCAPAGTPAAAIENRIAALRAAGLWSNEPHKVVPADHKQKYAEQMRFVACAQFGDDQTRLLAARYDHPKFPSDAARFAQWLEVLGAG